MAQSIMKQEMKVVAQKADPEAVISKQARGGFESTVIVVLEDGTERKHRVSSTRKRDLVKKLEKLPISDIRGMTVSNSGGWFTYSLFEYNGV